MEARRLTIGLVAAALVAACEPALSNMGASASPAAPSPATSTPAASASGSARIEDLRVSTAGWTTDFTRASVDLADFRAGGPPKDGIPSIDKPVFESLDDARAWLADRSPVISLDVAGEARAYPIAILMWHEIVNDTVGGTPVVVTFCPLCNTALVFDRTLGGVLHAFGTTGNLRYSDLVMYDRQTESWWQQATGEAVVGSLTGARLRFIPAQIVSFAEFAATHPDGVVLSRDTGFSRRYGENPYVGYDDAASEPFLFEGVVDGRLAPKERVVTIDERGRPTAYPFSELRQTGVATGTVDGRPVVVFWAPGTASALDAGTIDDGDDVGATGVFQSEIDGEPVTFRRDGGEDAPITDVETGSLWSVSGLATAGPRAGTRLQAVPHGNHFWFAWAAFSPDTVVWTAP